MDATDLLGLLVGILGCDEAAGMLGSAGLTISRPAGWAGDDLVVTTADGHEFHLTVEETSGD